MTARSGSISVRLGPRSDTKAHTHTNTHYSYTVCRECGDCGPLSSILGTLFLLLFLNPLLSHSSLAVHITQASREEGMEGG